MSSIKIGKFEISPQAGQAGAISVGHKLTERHTGRNKYQKLVRASLISSQAPDPAIETLEIVGLAPFLTLKTAQTEITYNVTTATISGVSNASKFRVSSSGKSITLVANTGYTISGNEGTFTAGFGEQNEGDIAVKVQFGANNGASGVTIPVKFEFWNGSSWAAGGTHNIIQSSSDADVSFSITPSTLEVFPKEGGKQAVQISSNIAYSIELQGDSDTSWASLDRLSGTAGTNSLYITASAQLVGSAPRELSIIFKNNLTNSVIGTLTVSQEQGEYPSISWQYDTLTFTNEDVNTIKTNTLTANLSWYLEEKIN